AVEPSRPANDPPPELEPAPEPTDFDAGIAAPPVQPERRTARRLGARVHVRAGALVRKKNAVDAAVSAGLRAGAVLGPAFHLELGAWSGPPVHGLTIVELVPTLGFGWSFAPTRRVELEPMLLAGMLVHVWHYDRMRKAKLDGNFELPFE